MIPSINEPCDVERLLGVLGVPELPYRNFRKSGHSSPSQPLMTSASPISSAFPLLVAAIPEIADSFVQRQVETAHAHSVTLMQEIAVPDAGGAGYIQPPTTPTPPPMPPAPTPRQSSQAAALIHTSPIGNPPAQIRQEPSRATATQIQGVFDLLRGGPGRVQAEAESIPGIHSLFHRR